ncbi:MAG: hypothetical protein JST61_01025 [Acidobacteria bacterium]|nr:hypothetical protein [Acidobacteriota bacterium]
MNACIENEIDSKAQQPFFRRYRSELFFALCASLYILPFMRMLVLGTDEGTLIDGAVRVVNGQVFAKDFLEVMGPGTFYWLALFFKLFGVTFMATRICLFVTSLGTALLMFCLTRKICRPYAALPPVLLMATYCWGWPTISHHIDSNFFALLGVMSACLWLERRVSIWIFFAGLLAGFTTCFMQPKGMLLIVAQLAWLLIEKRRQQRPVATSVFGFCVGGYCVATGLVMLYFVWHGALRDLVYANFVFPHRNYDAVNIVPYARGIVAYYWNTWHFKPGIGFAIGAVLLLPYLLIAVLPGLLPVLGIFLREKVRQPYLVLFWLCGWALWFSEIHRKDIIHLIYGSPLLIILVVYYAERLPVRSSTQVLQALTISAVCLAGYNLLFLLFAHPLKTRVGAVTTFREEKLARVLEQKTYPGEEIFTYPYCPIYYFLTETKNPTRYSFLMYHYNTPAQFQEALQVLVARRVKYVVWNTHFQDVAVRRVFPSVKQLDPAPLIIEPYLESHYRPIWSDENSRLMELKTDGPATEKALGSLTSK